MTFYVLAVDKDDEPFICKIFGSELEAVQEAQNTHLARQKSAKCKLGNSYCYPLSKKRADGLYMDYLDFVWIGKCTSGSEIEYYLACTNDYLIWSMQDRSNMPEIRMSDLTLLQQYIDAKKASW